MKVLSWLLGFAVAAVSGKTSDEMYILYPGSEEKHPLPLEQKEALMTFEGAAYRKQLKCAACHAVMYDLANVFKVFETRNAKPLGEVDLATACDDIVPVLRLYGLVMHVDSLDRETNNAQITPRMEYSRDMKNKIIVRGNFITDTLRDVYGTVTGEFDEELLETWQSFGFTSKERKYVVDSERQALHNNICAKALEVCDVVTDEQIKAARSKTTKEDNVVEDHEDL